MMVPESVCAYLQDRGTRRAIIGLRRVGSTDLLEGLEWSELSRFYRARQAVQQFETEWATFAIDLWFEVWNGTLDSWTSLTPDEQHGGGHDAGISTANLLDTGDDSLWFGRVFTERDWTLYAAVSGIPERGIVVKIWCGTESRSARFPSFAEKPDEADNWVSPAIPILNGAIDVSALRTIAEGAAACLPTTRRVNARNVDPERSA